MAFPAPLNPEESLTKHLQNFGPEVKRKASIYVPAIGKVTIVVLLRNLLRIVQNRNTKDYISGSASDG
jgi:methylenetetrahydrofolate dehydrogenase (NAD+)